MGVQWQRLVGLLLSQEFFCWHNCASFSFDHEYVSPCFKAVATSALLTHTWLAQGAMSCSFLLLSPFANQLSGRQFCRSGGLVLHFDDFFLSSVIAKSQLRARSTAGRAIFVEKRVGDGGRTYVECGRSLVAHRDMVKSDAAERPLRDSKSVSIDITPLREIHIEVQWVDGELRIYGFAVKVIAFA